MKENVVKPLTPAEWAARIARELFTNSMKQRADHLVMMTKDHQNLGGWSKKAVAERIEAHLSVIMGLENPK